VEIKAQGPGKSWIFFVSKRVGTLLIYSTDILTVDTEGPSRIIAVIVR